MTKAQNFQPKALVNISEHQKLDLKAFLVADTSSLKYLHLYD